VGPAAPVAPPHNIPAVAAAEVANGDEKRAILTDRAAGAQTPPPYLPRQRDT